MSNSGTWRVPAIFYGLKYATSKGRFLSSVIHRSADFYAQSPVGFFHCRDFASAYQLGPRWEEGIKRVVSGLKDSLFVDVGANIGYYSVMAAKNGNRVIAIEPNQKTFDCLVDTIRLNKLKDKIEAIRGAAWSSYEMLKMGSPGYSDRAQVGRDGEEVQGFPLDYIFAGIFPKLVKIDVEGAEPSVLRGMHDTMARVKPRIIFEALTELKEQECKEILRSSGYTRFQRLDSTNHIAVD